MDSKKANIASESGATKAEGKGLGFLSAKQSIQSLNGDLRIESTSPLGTVVVLTFPKAPRPDWFLTKLSLRPDTNVIVVDDDQSVHEVWKELLGKFSNEISLFHSPEELAQSKLTADGSIFLIDFEFNNSELNGIELIQKLGIAERSVLVTSHYSRSHIRSAAQKLGVKILPKNLITLLPIEISEKVDLVLIDDDPIMRESWEMTAEIKRMNLRVYENSEPLESLDRATPIFIDKNLGNGVSGFDVAKKFHLAGFDHIFITTGDERQSIDETPSFVRAIVGKEFPPSL